MKKICLFLILFLTLFVSSCSLNTTTFEETMNENNYYVETLSEQDINLIKENFLSSLPTRTQNLMPVTICIVRDSAFDLNVTKIIKEEQDYQELFQEGLIGIVLDYSNFINAEVAYGLKDDLLESLKDQITEVNSSILDFQFKKIGSALYFGTSDFISLVS